MHPPLEEGSLKQPDITLEHFLGWLVYKSGTKGQPSTGTGFSVASGTAVHVQGRDHPSLKGFQEKLSRRF